MNEAQSVARSPEIDFHSRASNWPKSANFLILFLAGMLVFHWGGYWPGSSPQVRGAIKTALPLLFLVLTWLCGRAPRLQPWRKASLALLAASSGFCVAWWASGRLLAFFGAGQNSIAGIALSKFSESLLIVLPALLVARAGGMTNQDLCLQRGKARAWIAAGSAGFAVFGGIFLIQAANAGMTPAQLKDLAPWALLFVLSNGFMEELHFRGLLLKPFENLLGPLGANLCIALFFTLIHAPAQYAPDILPFLGIVFVLALLWGILIQKTDSLWGAVLIHAGADLLIIVGVFQTLGAIGL